jgi:uncharacterized RDD family membrane protein YckC
MLATGFALLPAVTPGAGSAATPSGTLYRVSGPARLLIGSAMFMVCGLYCSYLWSGGRRTLAMKTWRLILVTACGGRVGVARAVTRYVACWAGPVLAIAGFAVIQPFGFGRWAAALLAVNYLWAVVDPERQFLQDRIAGTRLRNVSGIAGNL